ncbi:wHTH domain-containing protein [Kitasatospora cineracea]|uniref:wHTH domain-containing protein n=1 Tax=Kitasatospora cineracea TaxID=88074 RepID=UPI003675ECDB
MERNSDVFDGRNVFDGGTAGSLDGGNVFSGGTAGSVVQAGRIGTVHVHAAPAEPSAPGEEWARLVAESAVWSRLRPGSEAEPWKRQAVRAAAELACFRDGLAPQLADDPWQDPDVVRRFVRAVGRLLGEPGDGFLYPAEAAVLVLLPMVYRVRALQLACGERPERYGEEHRQLADRARTEPALAHWLWHRHLARHADLAEPAAVTALLAALPGAELRAALTPLTVRTALGGLRRGAGVANREFLHDLTERELIDCEGHQTVRPPRLVLLTALAYALAVEATALPEIVADHLGIQDPVLLPQLLSTLREMHWGGSPGLPVLRAECHHEAVAEALREYVAHADELLHAVQRTLGSEAVTGLPLRLSSANVAPAPGTFKESARFRLNERQMRSLLMGEQLYHDRDLAVRELYQNALDACRYRKARADYLVRKAGGESSGYRGLITLEQGVDEQGRPYLECRDNGIGMGEAELRGVFSKAGERFAEQQELLEERALWQGVDPPVELYPNSRFGIGVLSYFMLAERMTVTTCRMGRDSGLGPELAASIHGPGHLFRITPQATARTEPGTAVRLYLDEGVLPDGWSAVGVLERLLGIAEFETTATHRGYAARWEPGVLRPRDPRSTDQYGLTAYGRFVPWDGAPAGVQVVWCEEGGGLLVDGLVVSLGRRGQASTGGSTENALRGAVVNLSGPAAPGRLSVDRREVLDDLSAPLDGLLRSAAHALVRDDRGLLRDRWLLDLGQDNRHLCDLITEAVRGSAPQDRPGALPELIRRQGFFPEDHGGRLHEGSRLRPPLTWLAFLIDLPTPWFLWRVLAHRPHPLADVLISLVPELAEVGQVLTALPSDLTILNHLEHPELHNRSDTVNRAGGLARMLSEQSVLRGSHHSTLPRVRALRVLDWWGRSPATVSELGRSPWNAAATTRLLDELGVPVPDPVLAVAAAYDRGDQDRLLLPWRDRTRSSRRLEPGEPVPLGHLALAAQRTGLPLAEVADQLADLGLPAAPALPRSVPEHLVPLLSRDFDGLPPWIGPDVPPDHLLRASALTGHSPAAMARAFEDIGLRCSFPEDLPDAELLSLAVRFLAPDDHPLPFRFGPGFDSPLFRSVMCWTARRSSAVAAFPGDDPFDLAVVGLLNKLGQEPHPPVTDALPFSLLVPVASSLRITPSQLAQRLHALGIPSSSDELPPGLPEHAALRLQTLLYNHRRANVRNMLQAAQEFGTTLPQVAEWARLLGYDTPDPAVMIREAIPFIPLAED